MADEYPTTPDPRPWTYPGGRLRFWLRLRGMIFNPRAEYSWNRADYRALAEGGEGRTDE